MKNKLIGGLIAVVLLATLGFLLKSVINDKVKLGIYYLEKNDSIYVKLMGAERFEFYTNIAKSYVARGKFDIEENILSLKVSEDEVYNFEIKEDSLILKNDIDEILKSGSIFELSYID